jgi:hypothetical protein
MEPHKTEKPVESRREGQAPPPRPPKRKPRFHIVKLEERIAPRLRGNHHERIAHGLRGNHNKTLVRDRGKRRKPRS